MNLGTLRARTKTRFRDSAAIIVSDSTWNQHIEAAYRHFMRVARWPWLITSQTFNIVQDQRRVTVGADIIGSLEDVYDQTHARKVPLMPKFEKWRFDLHLQNQEGSDGPAFFRVVGNDLYLIPTPNQSLTLEVFYFTEPAALDSDSDVPEIPERYHEALVDGALSIAYRDDENLQLAEAAYQMFLAKVQQAMEELLPGEVSSIRQQVGAEAGAGSGGASSSGASSIPDYSTGRFMPEG